jgi:hypothetical protein
MDLARLFFLGFADAWLLDDEVAAAVDILRPTFYDLEGTLQNVA